MERFEAVQRERLRRSNDSCEGKEKYLTEARQPTVTDTRFTPYSTYASNRLNDDSRERDSRESDRSFGDRRALDSFSRYNTLKRGPAGHERDSFKHERSDRRDRDIRQAITLPRNSCHKSARETDVTETNFGRDDFQRGGRYSSSLPKKNKYIREEDH